MALPYVGEIMLAGFTFAPQGWASCDGQLLPISQNETLFQLIGTTYGGDGEVTFAMPDLRGRVAVGTGQGPGLSNYGLAEAAGSETVTLTSAQMPAHTHAIDATALTAAVRVKNAVGTQSGPAGHVFAIDSPPFTNPTLTAGADAIRVVHVTELRSRIDSYRTSVGLSPFTYTDPTLSAGTTLVKAAHIAELRTSLRQAYVRAGLAPPTFTDDPLAAGTTAKTAHITELRTAVTAVAGGAATYSSAAPGANMAPGAITLAGSVSPPAGGNQPHDNRQPFLALNYCISLFGIFPPMA
jgi:microcystin-dependent protein